MEKINQRIIERFLTASFKRLHCGIVLLAVVFVCSPYSAWAISIISDEETEAFLYKTAEPYYRAANIPIKRDKIFIVQDDSLNAFVSEGNNLFLHTGTIMAADNRNELSGVIAHEVGHIAGGHILRGKIQAQELQRIELASLILAGAATAVGGRADAAMAVMLGGQSSLLHSYSSFRTAQERSADEAAVKYLSYTKESPQGMLNFMKKIRARNKMSGNDESIYFRTHPLTSERINFMEKAVRDSKYKPTFVKDEAFERIKAKLSGFLLEPEDTYRRYPNSDNSIAGKYARAIADFKALNIGRAIKQVDELISQEPKNPYFRELKAQIYMETGKVSLAKKEYAKALEILPSSPLFQINWAQSVLEDSPTKNELNRVVNILNQTIIKYPSPLAWLLLSKAYSMQKNTAYSQYAAAEYSLGIGEEDIAKQQALRAQKNSNIPSTLKLKLDDLLKRIEDIPPA